MISDVQAKPFQKQIIKYSLILTTRILRLRKDNLLLENTH
ncbi:hypothetical protein FUAX_06260 [Fulvitalea axinellae]|uniref:Uncharacterized protein n=1 Tax=Fulvitalea axinellae TaxID=1182444 RepID=A0AAU9D186_9BACT|nr:hypothetical protein FUAX_06260 [Fulvitalea axinellae]